MRHRQCLAFLFRNLNSVSEMAEASGSAPMLPISSFCAVVSMSVAATEFQRPQARFLWVGAMCGSSLSRRKRA
jgi:hypothetical protein